jgi:hypothetical protein
MVVSMHWPVVVAILLTDPDLPTPLFHDSKTEGVDAADLLSRRVPPMERHPWNARQVIA